MQSLEYGTIVHEDHEMFTMPQTWQHGLDLQVGAFSTRV